MPNIFSRFNTMCLDQYQIPSIRSLQKMDGPTIRMVLDACADYNANGAVKCICCFLESSLKLQSEQKLAVMEALLNILRHQTVNIWNIRTVSNTVWKFLLRSSSEFTFLEMTACRVEIELARWLLDVVLVNIISLFGKHAIPHAAVAWCLQQLVRAHTSELVVHVKYILEGFLPVMEKAKHFNHRLWFSRAFERLARAYARGVDAELVSLFLKGYTICHSYLDAPSSSTMDVHLIHDLEQLILHHMKALPPHKSRSCPRSPGKCQVCMAGCGWCRHLCHRPGPTRTIWRDCWERWQMGTDHLETEERLHKNIMCPLQGNINTSKIETK